MADLYHTLFSPVSEGGHFEELAYLLGTIWAVSMALIWYKWFYTPGPKNQVTNWSGLKKLSLEEKEILVAQDLMNEGSYHQAEMIYRTLLQSPSASLEVQLGLAESLYQQINHGIRNDAAKKQEALRHYQGVLEGYLAQKRLVEMFSVYERLLGPYSQNEIGDKYAEALRPYAEELGRALVPEDRVRLREKNQAKFDKAESAQNYPQAYASFTYLLETNQIEELSPTLLCRGAEICLKLNDVKLAERVFETVARRGDRDETVRALSVLSRYWLKTPKQPTLSQLYKDSGQRLATIDDHPQWVELGIRLRE
jgi:hypothetical protein